MKIIVRLFKTLLLLLAGCIFSSRLQAAMPLEVFQSDGMSVQLEQVAEGFGIPWGMAFVDSGKLLITDRGGSLRLLDLTTGSIKNIANVPPVLADNQGGLLDIKLSPDFSNSGWIYFTYVKNVQGKGATTLARAKLSSLDSPDIAINSWQDLLVSRSASSADYHFGSRIAFDTKGHVFFGVGDRGNRPNAQDLTNHAGCILRLNLDGTIPADNPFIHKKHSLPEIWSYGHRNPQGMAYDVQHGRLWEIEHGPRGGDEINLIEAGKNYGWPVISYGKEYWGPVAVGEGTHKRGMEQPVKVYVPSIAPGSLLFYTGQAFPEWQGNLLAGALKLQHINRVVLDENAKATGEERLLENLHERIRALVQSPLGWIYFSTDSGKIFRLRPQSWPQN